MKTKDFENALREGMRFDAFVYGADREVICVTGTVTDDVLETKGVWNEEGKFYAFLEQKKDDYKVIPLRVGGPNAMWRGGACVRTPFFDLKFD